MQEAGNLGAIAVHLPSDCRIIVIPVELTELSSDKFSILERPLF